MNKYTIQFNIVAKGVNELGDKFTDTFFNYLDNWGNNYFEEIDDTEEGEYVQAWEDVEFHVKNNGLFPVFNQGGMEALTPVWRVTNINASIYGDLWEEIVDEIARNSSWYFMNITGYNMTIDLIEDGKGAIQRFELGEYIQNKALEGRY